MLYAVTGYDQSALRRMDRSAEHFDWKITATTGRLVRQCSRMMLGIQKTMAGNVCCTNLPLGVLDVVQYVRGEATSGGRRVFP